MVVDEYFRIENLIECAFWNVFGLGFLISAMKPSYRRLKLLAWPVLAVFGMSDYVESHTGAWWDPWWLLVWKAACILALVVLLVVYMKSQRAAQAKGDALPAEQPPA